MYTLFSRITRHVCCSFSKNNPCTGTGSLNINQKLILRVGCCVAVRRPGHLKYQRRKMLRVPCKSRQILLKQQPYQEGIGWTEHIAHMGDERCVQNLFPKPEEKRLLRTFKRRWQDNIKVDHESTFLLSNLQHASPEKSFPF